MLKLSNLSHHFKVRFDASSEISISKFKLLTFASLICQRPEMLCKDQEGGFKKSEKFIFRTYTDID